MFNVSFFVSVLDRLCSSIGYHWSSVSLLAAMPTQVTSFSIITVHQSFCEGENFSTNFSSASVNGRGKLSFQMEPTHIWLNGGDCFIKGISRLFQLPLSQKH